MDGKPFKVRVVIVENDKRSTEQTLVMTHGFFGASVVWMRILKDLAERYRLVLID